MGRYFLSYGGVNRAAARALSQGLRTAGVEIFADEEIQSGSQWLARLESELTNVDGFLALIGSGPIEGWARAELDVALDRHVKNPEFRLIPVLLPSARPEDLPPFLARFQAHKLPVDPIQATTEQFSTLSLLLGLRQLEEKSQCPFPGLEPFDESLAPFFFGRAAEIDDLIRLAESNLRDRRRWIQIEGPSGSGKSSLAMAGLVPQVRRGRLPIAAASWCVGVMRPGSHPLRSLAQAMQLALKGRLKESWDLDRLSITFAASESSLANLIREHTTDRAGVLLVVDQLEELVTLAGAEVVAITQLVTLLKQALDDYDIAFYLITTIRSDFVSHLNRLQPLQQLLNYVAIRYTLRALSAADGLRLAIEGPSQVAGLHWEQGLVERILSDASACAGGLALVAHVLYALWATRQQDILTHSSYTSLGGVTGALTLSADAVVDRLSVDEQALVKSALLCLVKTTDDSQVMRRSASRSEVLGAMQGGPQAETLLTYLSGGRTSHSSSMAPAFMRIVAVTQDASQDRVDLIHDALFRAWPRFRNWIEESRGDLKCRDALESAASAWAAAGRPRHDLPARSQLKYFRHARTCNQLSLEFLEAAAARAAQLRRTKLAMACTIVFALVSGYVVACDLGLRVPGGAAARLMLDEYGLSLLRPLPAIDEIRQKAQELRSALCPVLERRQTAFGRVHSDYDLSLGTDSWATSQTVAAMLGCDECCSTDAQIKWAALSLQAAFEPQAMSVDKKGNDIGWIRNEYLNTPMAEPALWTEVAISKAFANPRFLELVDVQVVREWFSRTEAIVRRFRSQNGVALNSFPHQKDLGQWALYPTVMELLARLEARSSGVLPKSNDGDAEIVARAGWVSKQFNAQMLGWPASPGFESGPVIDGLTLQTCNALLWAEQEVGFAIPDDILAAIPLLLLKVQERPYGYPCDQVRYSAAYQRLDGSQTTANEDIVFLWYPWAVQVACRWLQRAAERPKQRGRDMVIAHRALAHLIVDMAGEITKTSTQTYTYEVAETVYGLSAPYLREGHSPQTASDTTVP
jgi:hypothetical protein